MNNSLNFNSNFNTKWALCSIIDGANLEEFEVGEDCVAKKKKNKFGRLLEPRISGTARPIPFKFDTLVNETVGHLGRDFD